MKFTASPLVVAVALGLIGPIALEPDTEDTDAGGRECTSQSSPQVFPTADEDEAR